MRDLAVRFVAVGTDGPSANANLREICAQAGGDGVPSPPKAACPADTGRVAGVMRSSPRCTPEARQPDGV